MLDDARIAVVVPAHNEALLLGDVLAGVPPYVDDVFVVDDASVDGTAEVAARVDDARVRVVCHERNRGVGAAIVTGYRAARRSGADVVAVMAGDNQMHPDDLLLLLRPIVAGEADYAKGDRLRHPDVTAIMPWTRRVGSRCLSVLTRWSLGMPTLSDSQSGYTAISGEAIDRMELESLWPRFGYPNDLLGLLCRHGLRTVDVVVRPVYAGETSELRGYHLPTILWVILRAGWRARRG